MTPPRRTHNSNDPIVAEAEVYFEVFRYTEPIRVALTEGERILSVENHGENRQVWFERIKPWKDPA